MKNLETITENNAKPMLVADLESLKNFWVCVNRYGDPNHFTIMPFKKWSIKKFLEGTRMDWDEAKSYGNKCIKVDVSFKVLHLTYDGLRMCDLNPQN